MVIFQYLQISSQIEATNDGLERKYDGNDEERPEVPEYFRRASNL